MSCQSIQNRSTGGSPSRVITESSTPPHDSITVREPTLSWSQVTSTRPTPAARPAVTTVSQPLRDLGRKAAARLRARIEDRGLLPRAEILSTHLVIRASCGCPQR